MFAKTPARNVVASLVGAILCSTGVGASAEEPLKLAGSQLEPIKWTELAGWSADDHLAAFAAYQASCQALRKGHTDDLYPRLVALLGSFLFLLLVPFLPRHELSPTLDLLSILLMLSGSILATAVLLYLGRSFSILPEARRLVVTGPYRFVRDPLYATEMICMLGLVIQFALWPAVIVFLIQLVIQLERMRIEEQLLNRTFPEYEIYANNTARLIPGLC
jgi:protein-S-isoprenylcysteine O-methyltransferase Ste14